VSIFTWQIKPYSNRCKEILLIGSQDNVVNRELITAKYKEIKLKIRDINSEQLVYKEISEADEIFLSRGLDKKIRQGIIKYCLFKGKPISIYPELFEIAIFKSQIEQINNVPLLKITGLRISRIQKSIKNIMDFLVATILTIVSLPILLLMAALIKLYDRGPIIFRQVRVTQGARNLPYTN